MKLKTLVEVAEILAGLGAVVALILSILSLQASREALSESRLQAFFITGGQQCIDYRNQILTLHEEGLTDAQIIRVFRDEPGEPNNFKRHPDGAYVVNAYYGKPPDIRGYVDGCGSVETVTRHATKGQRP